MNWAKLKEQAIIKPKPLIGCGIAPGFNTKQYEAINSQWFDLADKYPEFEMDYTAFELFGEDDIQNLIHVTTPIREAFDDSKTGSVLDIRFGTNEKDQVCGTCCQTMLTCHGHYGYFKLKRPLIHPLYFHQTIQLLKAVCHNCGELIYNVKTSLLNETRTDKTKRLTYYATKGANKRICSSCGSTNPIVTAPSLLSVDAYTAYKGDLFEYHLPNVKMTKDTKGQNLSINQVETILSSISKTALSALGIRNNMRNLVMKYIIVTPISTRPGVNLTGTFENSNMTLMYDHILRLNQHDDTVAVFKKKDKTEIDRVVFSNNLFRMVHRLINRSDPKVPFIDLFVNLKEQLSKKSGLLRSSAMGKRINFSSRTVLSPASETSVGEMSYPTDAAKQITIPEVVNIYNIERLRSEWEWGDIMAITPKTQGHPHYNQLLFCTTSLKTVYKPFLKDICHRRLKTGDVVMFNRQPTLDRYSLMAYQAKLVPRNMRVHGINSCATKPHNADFDGDEGNVYISQTIESQVEGRLLTGIRNNIISMSTSRPTVSIQYHGLISLYNLTKNEILLDQEDWDDGFDTFWNNKAAFIPGCLHGYKSYEDYPEQDSSDFDYRLRQSGIPLTSGRALFSSILPPDLYYNRGPVKIRNGILISGPLTKKDMGGSNMGLVHVISLYGNDYCSDFLSSAQKMADWYLTRRGVSMALTHLRPLVPQNQALRTFYMDTSNTTNQVTDELLRLIHLEFNNPNRVDQLEEWVRTNRAELIERASEFGLDREFVFDMDTIVQNSHFRIEERVANLANLEAKTALEIEQKEANIMSITGMVDGEDKDAGLKLLGKDNPFVQLVDSGAKGSNGNIAQMTTSIGQTSVYGKRPQYEVARTRNFIEGSRTLCFYLGKEDPGFVETIESRGYINSSYTRGMDPAQFVFMMAHERIGVITSRTSTAESGYFGRQVMKFCEDVRINAMGDVVTAQDRYVAPTIFDGLDMSKLVGVRTQANGMFSTSLSLEFIIKRLITENLQNE